MEAAGLSNLGRRLSISYAIAFAVVLAVFAVSVRFAFVAMLERQVDARLETLARAGLAAVRVHRESFAIEPDVTLALRPDQEGLQWFNIRGRFVDGRGLVPEREVVPRIGEHESIPTRNDVLLTRTIEVRDRSGLVIGFVRASESDDAFVSAKETLDIGIAIGAVLSTIAATASGWFLTKQAIRSSEESFQRLRQFTADAAHELRGPIGAIANNAQLGAVEDDAAATAAGKQFAAIEGLAREMRRLVDDLLILARAGQPMTRELFVIDVDEVLQRVYSRLAPVASAQRVSLRLSRSQGETMYGNPEQVERLIANLVENAIRYTPENGTIEVEASRSGAVIEVRVRDTGSGIAPEHVPHIFDRFWRADPVRGPKGSSGLGLSIALALARRHGGDLTVKTALGVGSTFTLTLPRRPAA